MPERRVLRSRTSLTSQMQPAKAAAASMSLSRPRRAVSGSTTQSIRVARGTPPPPDDPKKSIRIRFTMPSSKLREVTSGSPVSTTTVGVNSRDSFEGGQIMTGPRGSRAKRPVVEESESDEEDEDEVGGDEDDQQDDDDSDDDELDAEVDEDEDDDEAENDDSADAEADLDADGDIVMDEQPSLATPPPPPAVKTKVAPTKPSLTLTPAQEGGKFKAKELELADDDDEELSELDSEAEEDEGAEADADADAEGEEVAEMDESMDQDDENPSVDTGSRASTPDVSKMTKRQRSRLDQVIGGDFLQLPMEPQIKKHLTAEEHAMRRAEMARRRKNLSEKRNEEEKMDTINRLLKKQAPKRRGKILPSDPNLTAGGTPVSSQPNKNITAATTTTIAEDGKDGGMEMPKANPVFVRWVSDAKGCRVGVPEEWLGKGVNVGSVFSV